MIETDAVPSLEERIRAFEALSRGAAPVHVSKSTSNLLDTPSSSVATSFVSPSVPPTPPHMTHSSSLSPSPSPPILGRKTSLINMDEWELDDGPPRFRSGADRLNNTNAAARLNPPTIHVEKPKGAPPLPPRKPSYASLRSVSAASSSSSLARSPSAGPVRTRTASDSLTVDHSYPPPLPKLSPAAPARPKLDSPGHAPASSISSFCSVSLSDSGTESTAAGSLYNHHVATYPVDYEPRSPRPFENDADAVSLDESFENVSPSVVASPITTTSTAPDWREQPRRPEPPKLPQRPKPPSTPAATTALAPGPRHPPPPLPPPSRTRAPSARNSLASTTTSVSDRSSILSIATSRTSISSVRPAKPTAAAPSSTQLARPTPVPPAAVRRYESVFVGNLLAQRRRARPAPAPPARKPRQAAGWRGLSVDLITNPEENRHVPRAPAPPPVEAIAEEVAPDERLSGATVRMVWGASRLERAKLRAIWNECDPAGSGSLDRDAFVKGMWRIDEELRRAQVNRRAPSGSPSKGKGVRQPSRAGSRPILR